MCPDVRYNNFKVLRSSIVLDKFNLECSDTVKSKPTRNDSVFIHYSNTINLASICLDNSGYLINQWQKNCEKQAV